MHLQRILNLQDLGTNERCHLKRGKSNHRMSSSPLTSAPDLANAASRNGAFTPVGSQQETEFLEGPHSRWKELLFLFRVMRQFFVGLRKLHFIGPCVTVFGSARFSETHAYYGLAREIGQEIARLGFTVITGGGPGIMEAANRGAKDVGGRSVGCNIQLPREQSPNQYLDRWITLDYFFVRKTLLTKYSYAFVVLPGGYGTLDEFFEAITLIQTGKFQRFPVVLMGTEFHEALYEHLQKLVEERTIDAADLKLFLFTNSVEAAREHIQKHAIEGFGLKKRKRYRPFGILGERILGVNARRRVQPVNTQLPLQQ
jgi:uncharacterized protein (TIGR00730 family)